MPILLPRLAATLLTLPLMAAEPAPTAQDRLAWWREARFGMFIHGGLYAITGKGEWQSFGMDQGDCRRLMESLRASGLKVGLYYSPMDWRFPSYFFPEMYRDSAEAMPHQCHAQVRELMTGYGPIYLLWWDGGSDDWRGFGGIEWGQEGWRNRDSSWPPKKRYAGRPVREEQRLMAMVRQLQPALITNDRSGGPGDFHSREHKIGDFDNTAPWEKCATLNQSWDLTNQPPQPMADLLRQRSQTVCRDGNFLLNIGPRADGSLLEDQVQRLREIGTWMRASGEAIRGTRGGHLGPTEHYRTTHRGDTVWDQCGPGPPTAA